MTAFDAGKYPPPCPHEPIREIATGLYLAPGSFHLAPLMQISRNMVIVCDGADLTLVNPIRLSPEGEAELAALGTVRHVIRRGFFHGTDDPYTVARFDAQFWCQANSHHHPDPAPDQILTEGGALPIEAAELFEFRETGKPECALLIRRGNGTLITCDGLQHYGDYSRHSIVAKITMPLMGFRRTVVIGPLWMKALTKKGGSLRPDFDRLLGLEFDSLVSAHGTPLMSGAHEAARKAVEYAFK